MEAEQEALLREIYEMVGGEESGLTGWMRLVN